MLRMTAATLIALAVGIAPASAQVVTPLEEEDTRAVESRFYLDKLDGGESVPGEEGLDAEKDAAIDTETFPRTYPDYFDRKDDTGDIEVPTYTYPASGLAPKEDVDRRDFWSLMPWWDRNIDDEYLESVGYDRARPDLDGDDEIVADEDDVSIGEAEAVDNAGLDVPPVLRDDDADLDTNTEIDQERDEDVVVDEPVDVLSDDLDDDSNDEIDTDIEVDLDNLDVEVE